VSHFTMLYIGLLAVISKATVKAFQVASRAIVAVPWYREKEKAVVKSG
jgi:hypothetical protein